MSPRLLSRFLWQAPTTLSRVQLSAVSKKYVRANPDGLAFLAGIENQSNFVAVL